MSNSPSSFKVDLETATLSATSRVAYDYWLEKRGGACFPPTSALDPLEIPREVLTNFTVIEVLEPGPRFLVRLTGAAVREAAGRDYTGQMVDQMPGAEEVGERFAWCVHHRKPYCVRSRLTWSTNDFRNYEALVLPFGEPGGPVRKLASVIALVNANDGPDHGSVSRL